MARPLRDFTAAPVRGRLEAALLAVGGDLLPAEVEAFLTRELASLTGTVVEIGPGPGTNLRRYPPGVRVIAVEPNPAMHPRLLAGARRRDVDLQLLPVHAERMDAVPDGSADAVVSTLVLCGVDDPAAVLAQVRRVLRPGGRLILHEHVVAAPGTATRLLQRVAKAPHRWLLNGCEVDRDTESLLRATFDDVAVRHVDAGPAAAWTRPRIIGTATAGA